MQQENEFVLAGSLSIRGVNPSGMNRPPIANAASRRDILAVIAPRASCHPGIGMRSSPRLVLANGDTGPLYREGDSPADGTPSGATGTHARTEDSRVAATIGGVARAGGADLPHPPPARCGCLMLPGAPKGRTGQPPRGRIRPLRVSDRNLALVPGVAFPKTLEFRGAFAGGPSEPVHGACDQRLDQRYAAHDRVVR